MRPIVLCRSKYHQTYRSKQTSGGEGERAKSINPLSPSLPLPLSPFLAFLLLGMAFVFPDAVLAQDQRAYQDASIRHVIDDIQAVTPYRFLYRDALITGKTVSFEAPTDKLIDALSAALRPHQLQLQVDEARQQILLSKAPKPDPAPPAVLTGQVIDDQSGARLPFATITWYEGKQLRGVAANAAGLFHLPLDVPTPNLILTASYVGYEARQIRLNLQSLPDSLPIRLMPETLFGHEVVINSTVLDAELDTTWHHLIRPGLFSPLGESSVYRSLQSLPAVSLSTAFSQGLNVRGSKADGFQILLDGIPIYNQNHLFGLFDAFNEDALQAVGFYYGVTPAHFQAPPGGTLSFVTRTGSQTDTRLQVGLTNTALKGTAEGPLWGGQGSWLLSGRHSYLNAVDWFNNGALVAQGLDVGRQIGVGRLERQPALSLGTSSARFFDLHGKLQRESPGGNRLMVNVYLGGDNTLHREAERAFNRSRPSDSTFSLQRQLVNTRNRWGNAAASVHDQRTLRPNVYSHTLLAFSHYDSRFEKDDFIYPDTSKAWRQPGGPDQPPPGGSNGPRKDFTPVIAPFEHSNDLVEWKLAQHIDVATRLGGVFSLGYALHRYTITYEEDSILRNGYGNTNRSNQFDFFAQYEGRVRDLDVQAGIRSHYFSQGRFLRLSPRLHVRLWPQMPVSLGLGYSRNHQFLHRLYLEHENSSDVWVMSTADQGPGNVDNLTGGIYVKAAPNVFFQAEAYLKSYENLRQHESIAAWQRNRPESVLFTPWIHDNQGRARGLELMLRHRLGPLLWTHSYTLSRMDIINEDIDNGDPFPADWDRRHQFNTHVQGTIKTHLTWHLTWLITSGAPNTLAYASPTEADRLPTYHRMDAGLTYQRTFQGVTLEATASVYNLYDQQNTWYRNPVPFVNGPEASRPVVYVPVDIYDLGFQPSFSFSFTF